MGVGARGCECRSVQGGGGPGPQEGHALKGVDERAVKDAGPWGANSHDK